MPAVKESLISNVTHPSHSYIRAMGYAITTSPLYIDSQSFIDPSLVANVYNQGRRDGANDMQMELIKRGKALFQLALDKISYITNELIQVAEKNEIEIISFHLKLDNWDSARSLILVRLDDFVSERIDELYIAANNLSSSVNNDTFLWEYQITYASDNISIETITTDGFNYHYEHSHRARKAQSEGL